MYSVLATNIVLVFAKLRDGSKSRQMENKIQRVASMLEEGYKLLRERKNLD